MDKSIIEGYIMDKSSYIYILQLEKDKYYVGFTERKDGDRFIEHFSGKGSSWTKLYKPIQVIEWRVGTLEDEDSVTLEMMNKYGWWNVRGGKWCKVVMEKPPEAIYKATTPSVFTLATSFINYMFSNVKSNPKQQKKKITTLLCYRCGRNSHLANKCYAKTHLSGHTL